MQKWLLLAPILLIASSCAVLKKDKSESNELPGAENGVVNDTRDTLSYAHGLNWAAFIKEQGIDLNPEAILKGYTDYMDTAAQAKMTKEESQVILQNYYQKLNDIKRKEQEEQARALQAENLAKAKAFFDSNGKREGVVTLPSGLQYEVLKEGDGPKPGSTDRVLTHYHGTLLDGTVFDSSVDRGEPISFGVNQVISGWTEALQLMPSGSKWKLYIPENLAYGSRGQGKIPPFSALVFEVELLKVNP